MLRDLLQWLDHVPTMDLVAIAAAIVLVGWWVKRQGARPPTHDEQVARRREEVRRLVNREFARREREGLRQGYPYSHTHWWN
jgi:hypothetical protein